MNVLDSLLRWKSDRRQIAEARVPLVTAYDQQFATYPDHIRRFLPAAYRQVRDNADTRLLEFQDKPRFRLKVAEAAFRMHRLSDSDSDRNGAQGEAEMQAESLTEQCGVACAGWPPLPITRIQSRDSDSVAHVRVWKREGDGGGFLVQLDTRTTEAADSVDLITLLLGAGVDVDDAMTLTRQAQRVGMATRLTYYFSNADIPG